jgi:lipopolysaccharide export LptBFGC system permease protein LptF
MAIRMPKKIDSINAWIDVATCGLAKDAWVRVREETYTHYESAREESSVKGASEQQAREAALASLGNARAANKQYKGIHLTAWENKLMRQDECAARALHARPYLWIVPVLLVCAAVAAFTLRPERTTLTLLVGAIGLCFVFGVPFMIPINTRVRGNIYRTIRLTWLVAIMWLAYGAEGPGGSWAMFFTMGGPILWMIAWMEWSRASARKKLPVAEWPRSLYL